jgi:hypothetical protein
LANKSSAFDRNQFYLENQQGIGWYQAGNARFAVSEMRADLHPAPASDLHALYRIFEAGNDLAFAEPEGVGHLLLERVAAME